MQEEFVTKTDLERLRDELIRMITDDVSLDPDEPIDADTDLLLTGLVDSLGVVQIVGWIEDRLGITIEAADVVLEHFQTPGLMMEYVQRRVS